MKKFIIVNKLDKWYPYLNGDTRFTSLFKLVKIYNSFDDAMDHIKYIYCNYNGNRELIVENYNKILRKEKLKQIKKYEKIYNKKL